MQEVAAVGPDGGQPIIRHQAEAVEALELMCWVSSLLSPEIFFLFR